MFRRYSSSHKSCSSNRSCNASSKAPQLRAAALNTTVIRTMGFALIDGDTTPGRKSFVGGGNKIAFVAFDARGRVGCGSLPALSRTMVGPTYQKKQGGFGSRPAGLGQVSQTVNHIVSLCACFHHRARS